MLFVQTLDPKLAQVLLEQGWEVLRALDMNMHAVEFPIQDSGRIVFDKALHLNEAVKCHLYDMTLVAKFYCKTGSWLDRLTLCGGTLWVWTQGQLPSTSCHIVVHLETTKLETKGTIVFPAEGGQVTSPAGGLCFGIVFNNL